MNTHSAQTQASRTYIRIWWRRYCCESHGGIVKILLHFLDYATQSWYNKMARNIYLGETQPSPDLRCLCLKGASCSVMWRNLTRLTWNVVSSPHPLLFGSQSEKPSAEKKVSVQKKLLCIVKTPRGEGMSWVSWSCSVHSVLHSVKETTLRPETQQLEAAYLLFHLPIGARREALVLRRREARRRSFRPSPSSLPARKETSPRHTQEQRQIEAAGFALLIHKSDRRADRYLGF